jgi:hypothetical protein
MPSREFSLVLRTRARKGQPTELLRQAKLALSGTGQTEYPFDYEDDDGVWRRIYCRCVGRAAPKNMVNRKVGRDVTVRFLASDPRLYSVAEYQVDGGIYGEAAGNPWGSAWGTAWAVAGGVGDIPVTNSGYASTWPRLEIHGPSSGGQLDSPSIELVTGGTGLLAFTQEGGLKLNPNEILIIETNPRLRDVSLGGAGRWNFLSGLIDDFELPQGSHVFRFRAAGNTTGAKLRIKWRDAEL